MTSYLSNKLRFVSSICMLMVLYIHMRYAEGNDMRLLVAIEDFVGYGLCDIAVPLFYMISGFLFFRRMEGYESVLPKIKRRVKTLLVPYLLTNLLVFAFYVLLDVICQNFESVAGVVNFRIIQTISDSSIFDVLVLVFVNPPIAFQLWFVRDLMLIVLFSPVILLVFRLIDSYVQTYSNIIACLCIAVLLFCGGFLHSCAWFMIGGWIGYKRINIEFHIQAKKAIFLVGLYLVIVIICQYYSQFDVIFSSLGIMIGILALWVTYDCVYGIISRCHYISFLTGYSFFIYLIHEPLLNIIKKIPLLFNDSQGLLIGMYLLGPLIFYYLGCFLGRLLSRKIPKVYYTFTGGR